MWWQTYLGALKQKRIPHLQEQIHRKVVDKYTQEPVESD
jgi:hypothetical protein